MLRWWLAVLVLGLAACGGDGGGGDGPEPNKPNEPNEETPEPKIVSVELSAEVTVVAQPPPPPTHGSLVIVLDGLPEEVAAGLKVTGPEGFETTVDKARRLLDLVPGVYHRHRHRGAGRDPPLSARAGNPDRGGEGG